jgi:hypothetical protein
VHSVPQHHKLVQTTIMRAMLAMLAMLADQSQLFTIFTSMCGGSQLLCCIYALAPTRTAAQHTEMASALPP